MRRYVHGDQVDEPWVEYSGNNTGTGYRTYLHADHQGSIIARTDGSGNYLAKLTYDSFGIPGATNTGRFGYTGQIWLNELGLFYYKARVYSPKLGRFLQTDPIFYADNMNMYAYVGNDPVNYNDPTGESRFRGTLDSGHVDVALEILVDEAVDQVANKTETGSVANSAARHLQRSNDTLRQAKATHGNSRASTKSQHRYEIRNKATGDVLKTGISGRPLNSNGTSPRANSQVNAINKTAAEGDKVEGEVKEKDIPGREAALNNEQAATNELKADGNSLRLQCRPKPDQSGGC